MSDIKTKILESKQLCQLCAYWLVKKAIDNSKSQIIPLCILQMQSRILENINSTTLPEPSFYEDESGPV